MSLPIDLIENEGTTFTATVGVWLNEFTTISDLAAYVERGEHQRAIARLCLWGAPDKDDFGSGYTRVGTADVTVHLMPRDMQARVAVAQLNAKLEKLREDFRNRQAEILAEISKFQALEAA